MKSVLAAALLVASLPAAADHACGHINAFHPETQVIAPSCAVDLHAPLETREGAIACQDEAGLIEAGNAMAHGWRYVASAGLNLHSFAIGERVSAQAFGCDIFHDGERVSILPNRTANQPASVPTSIGWVSISTLQNPADPPPVK